MKIIILSGGSGKRLWPLSNATRSKQFLKVLENKDGNSESMIQRIFGQIKKSCPKEDILIASDKAQSDSIRRHLGNQAEVVLEPSRRKTYPSILLACAYLLDKKGVSEDEVVAVLPVDPYVEQDYFEKLWKMADAVEESEAEICLLGIKPTYPSQKYGYITLNKEEDDTGFYRVKSYVEKPTLQTAQKLIKEGAFWNGGVFVFRASFAKKLIEKEIGQVSYEMLYEQYEKLPYNSFDYEVIEKSDLLCCVTYDGEWNDLGTWNTLTEKMRKPDGGFVIRGENCENTHVINELGIPIVALGLKDAVVVASADGILVSDKHASSYMMPYVEQIHNRPMYEKRQWGEYKVLDFEPCLSGKDNSLTKRLYIEPGKSLSYQLHHHRDEIWTVVDGVGYFLLDGTVREVTRGDVLYIRKEQKHAMLSKTGVTFIEVQIGTELVEEDIERFEWTWKEQ